MSDFNMPVGKVDRVEVVDQNGRSYTNYLTDGQAVVLSFQDNGRTLKLFVSPQAPT